MSHHGKGVRPARVTGTWGWAPKSDVSDQPVTVTAPPPGHVKIWSLWIQASPRPRASPACERPLRGEGPELVCPPAPSAGPGIVVSGGSLGRLLVHSFQGDLVNPILSERGTGSYSTSNGVGESSKGIKMVKQRNPDQGSSAGEERRKQPGARPVQLVLPPPAGAGGYGPGNGGGPGWRPHSV